MRTLLILGLPLTLTYYAAKAAQNGGLDGLLQAGTDAEKQRALNYPQSIERRAREFVTAQPRP